MTRKTWKRIGLALVVIMVLGLIGARLYLPVYLKDYVNTQLQTKLKGYTGSVESIDVALLRGAYVINDLKIEKTNGKFPVPFLAIKQTDLSLQWSALFKGSIVSDIHLDGATLNFAVDKTGTVKQTGQGANWSDAVKKLAPIDINVVTLENSKITYRDFSSAPKVDIFLKDLHGQITNLRNVDDKDRPLPSKFKFNGSSIGDGAFETNGAVNILKPIADFDGKLSLQKAKLPAVNSYSLAYTSIDFESGTLDVYGELVVKNGRVSGYVKPIATHVAIIDKREKPRKNLLEKIWEPIAAVVLTVFTNHQHDQIATRVVYEGRFDKVDSPFWPTIFGIVRNAFVEAYSHRIDELISYSHPTIADEGSSPVKQAQ